MVQILYVYQTIIFRSYVVDVQLNVEGWRMKKFNGPVGYSGEMLNQAKERKKQ